MKLIIADTGPLIHLLEAQALDLQPTIRRSGSRNPFGPRFGDCSKNSSQTHRLHHDQNISHRRHRG